MGAQKQKLSGGLLNDYHLLSFDTLDSTNEEAKRLARGGGCHGAVIWARQQTGGKGRLGRQWISSEGNLFVSVLLQPEKPVAELAQLSFVAAVSVIGALSDMFPESSRLSCKWPNDILLDDRKLCGILLESFETPEGKGPWVVVGVGVNVESFPQSTEFPATCLKEAGVELISAKIILSRFIHHFIESYNIWNAKGFAPIRKKWQSAAWGVGEKLVARLPDGNIEGIFQGIDTGGSLQLKLKSGKVQLVHAGDVFPAATAEA